MPGTDKSLRLTFGGATVLGVTPGSLIYALGARKFHREGFASIEDLVNQIVGGFLMAYGGVTAMGCPIGQGMGGISTLAIGSFIALSGIVAGSVATMKWQQR